MRLLIPPAPKVRYRTFAARRSPNFSQSRDHRVPTILVTMLLFTLAVALPANAQSNAANTDGWVVLPVGEYTALRLAAHPAAVEAAPPAVEATLSRLDYNL